MLCLNSCSKKTNSYIWIKLSVLKQVKCCCATLPILSNLGTGPFYMPNVPCSLCFINILFYYDIIFEISFDATSTHIVMIPCTCSIWFLCNKISLQLWDTIQFLIGNWLTWALPFMLYTLHYKINWKKDDALCKRCFHDITEEGIVILVIN